MRADTDKNNAYYDLAKGRPFSQFHFPRVTKTNIVALKIAVFLPTVPIGPVWAPFPQPLSWV
jgi:hypothetical protein